MAAGPDGRRRSVRGGDGRPDRCDRAGSLPLRCSPVSVGGGGALPRASLRSAPPLLVAPSAGRDSPALMGGDGRPVNDRGRTGTVDPDRGTPSPRRGRAAGTRPGHAVAKTGAAEPRGRRPGPAVGRWRSVPNCGCCRGTYSGLASEVTRYKRRFSLRVPVCETSVRENQDDTSGPAAIRR